MARRESAGAPSQIRTCAATSTHAAPQLPPASCFLKKLRSRPGAGAHCVDPGGREPGQRVRPSPATTPANLLRGVGGPDTEPRRVVATGGRRGFARPISNVSHVDPTPRTQHCGRSSHGLIHLTIFAPLAAYPPAEIVEIRSEVLGFSTGHTQTDDLSTSRPLVIILHSNEAEPRGLICAACFETRPIYCGW